MEKFILMCDFCDMFVYVKNVKKEIGLLLNSNVNSKLVLCFVFKLYKFYNLDIFYMFFFDDDL